MVQSIIPTSTVGDSLLSLEQGADGTSRNLPYQPDFWTEHALRQVYDASGDVIDVKPKSLLKFGSYTSLGTSFETVQTQGGIEVFQTSNTINTISSTDAEAVLPVFIEGHTIDGDGNFTFTVQSATLNGQNKVTLTTPLARCSRVYNAGASEFVGDVYVYRDGTITGGIPNDATLIHAVALAVDQQTQKCATTISNSDYWFITHGWASVNKKAASNVDFKLQVRIKGGVFRTQTEISLSNTSGSTNIEFRPFFEVPQNADVRVLAAASATGVSVSANINGILCTVRADN